MVAVGEIALLMVLVAQDWNQWHRDLADFTRSPTEHEIIILEHPFVVRSVAGVIILGPDSHGPLAAVLFEIEGPGTVRRIRRANTDLRGQFRITHVHPGTYRFKTTLAGFKSVAGTIIVSKKADPRGRIRIDTEVGN